jgi:hypothetical protein
LGERAKAQWIAYWIQFCTVYDELEPCFDCRAVARQSTFFSLSNLFAVRRNRFLPIRAYRRFRLFFSTVLLSAPADNCPSFTVSLSILPVKRNGGW